MDKFLDTICAPATSVGAGAISIIRISGTDALEITDKVVSFKKSNACNSEAYSLHMGTIYDNADILDETLVAVFKAPHSYTGENSTEIYCHSSRYIVNQILSLLCKAGARPADPGEFTQRAFINGKMDLAQAEAVADIISAQSKAAHDIAFNQLKGSYSLELKQLRDAIVEMKALLELELDFSEEDVEFADRSKLNDLLTKTINQVKKLTESFQFGNAVKNGIPVSIVGNVNAGKSTLLNVLVGEDRAIVSDIPGTTRDTIEETIMLNGLQFRFIDTAGIRETTDKIERKGIERSLSAIHKSDVVIGVLDGTASLDELEKSAYKIIDEAQGKKLILVRSKVDSYDRFNPEDFPTMDRSYGYFELKYPAFGTYSFSPDDLKNRLGREVLDISAATGEGIDALKDLIADTQAGRLDDGIIVTNARHFAALGRAFEHLDATRSALTSGISTELVAEHLSAAILELNLIFGDSGTITPDEVLGEIFGRFCIGK